MLLTDILVRSALLVDTTGASEEDEVIVEDGVRFLVHSGTTVSFFSVFTFTLVCGIVVDNLEGDHDFDATEESVETLPSGECISSYKAVYDILLNIVLLSQCYLFTYMMLTFFGFELHLSTYIAKVRQ